MTSGAFCGEDGIEGRCELRVPIADHESDWHWPVRQRIAEVRGKLGHPLGRRVRQDARDPDQHSEDGDRVDRGTGPTRNAQRPDTEEEFGPPGLLAGPT
jgi:hypothetical protein